MQIRVITLALAMSLAAHAVAAPPPYDGKPIGKIDPSKLPPVSTLPKPKNLPGLGTQIDVSFEGGSPKQNGDGSTTASHATTFHVSTPADGKHGAGEAVSMDVTRKDVLICSQGNVGTIGITPPKPPTTKTGGAFVASSKVYGDMYLVGVKCPSGSPERADVTFTIKVVTKIGTTVDKTVLLHLEHFNE